MSALFHQCICCLREHTDGNWAYCHDCAGYGLRPWLTDGINFEDQTSLIGVLIAARLFGVEL